MKAVPDPAEREALLYQLGQEQVRLIKEAMTVENVDLNNQPFIPSARALRDNGQTLVDTGKMVGSVDVVALSSESVTIGVSPAEADKAFKHQFGVGVKKRPWFGFRPGDLGFIQKVLDSFMKRRAA
jgi:hypothetical protein